MHKLPASNQLDPLTPVAYEPGLWNEAFAASRPLLVDGFVSAWPAYDCWSLDYFREKAGDARVHASALDDSGTTDLDPERRVHVTLSEALDRIEAQDPDSPDGGIYLAQRGGLIYLSDGQGGNQGSLAALLPDVEVPDVDRLLRMVILWVGSGRNTTYTHFDPLEGILGLIRGSKRIVMFPPSEMKNVYPHLSDQDPLGTRIDLQRVQDWPGLEKARYWDFTVEEGQAIYMPPGYWHCVTGQGLNIAVSQFWRVLRRTWITSPPLRALGFANLRYRLRKTFSRLRPRRDTAENDRTY
jgi:hypothetical protein